MLVSNAHPIVVFTFYFILFFSFSHQIDVDGSLDISQAYADEDTEEIL
jgi:hypothetical protein